MTQNKGRRNAVRKVNLRESNEAFLKMTNAMAASLEAARKAAEKAQTAAKAKSTVKPATKAKKAQRIVRSAHEGITDPQQLVAAAVAEGMEPAL